MARYRVLTFNIAHARGASPVHQSLRSGTRLRTNLLKIARLITRLEADIVAFQEIDEDSRWSGSFDHLEFLRAHTGLAYAVYGVNNRRAGRFHLNYGNAFLSRFPVHHHENVPFGRGTFGQKGFLFAEIDTPAGRLPLVNAHLHHRSRPVRLRQAAQLMRHLDHQRAHRQARWRTGPILCGDLNNAAGRPDATAGLRDYLAQFEPYALFPRGRGGRAAPTFPSLWPRRPLDYICLPSACHEPSGMVIRSFLSDHRPVLVEFNLTPA
jgi:endonuclease/exonuclease/phosphatase family metal-dependent hydrolase